MNMHTFRDTERNHLLKYHFNSFPVIQLIISDLNREIKSNFFDSDIDFLQTLLTVER